MCQRGALQLWRVPPASGDVSSHEQKSLHSVSASPIDVCCGWLQTLGSCKNRNLWMVLMSNVISEIPVVLKQSKLNMEAAN